MLSPSCCINPLLTPNSIITWKGFLLGKIFILISKFFFDNGTLGVKESDSDVLIIEDQGHLKGHSKT